MYIIVFAILVAGYLWGAFLSRGEKAEAYLDAAAILGLVGIFVAGRGMRLAVFLLLLAIYVGLLFAFYYFRLFKKGVKPPSRRGIPDVLLILTALFVKDPLAISLVCLAYLLVERYLFYRRFHALV